MNGGNAFCLGAAPTGRDQCGRGHGRPAGEEVSGWVRRRCREKTGDCAGGHQETVARRWDSGWLRRRPHVPFGRGLAPASAGAGCQQETGRTRSVSGCLRRRRSKAECGRSRGGSGVGGSSQGGARAGSKMRGIGAVGLGPAPAAQAQEMRGADVCINGRRSLDGSGGGARGKQTEAMGAVGLGVAPSAAVQGASENDGGVGRGMAPAAAANGKKATSAGRGRASRNEANVIDLEMAAASVDPAGGTPAMAPAAANHRRWRMGAGGHQETELARLVLRWLRRRRCSPVGGARAFTAGSGGRHRPEKWPASLGMAPASAGGEKDDGSGRTARSSSAQSDRSRAGSWGGDSAEKEAAAGGPE